MAFKLSPIQEEFINLLETTDQPQGKYALCTSEGFCCLGLWTVHRGVSVNPDFPIEKISFGGDLDCAYFENGERVVLSDHLKEELGLYGVAGESSTYEMSIAELNDAGLTFKEIAQVIRERPADFFIQQDEHNGI